MELMFAWFWIVKLILMFIFFYAFYKAFMFKLKSKFWNITAVIVFIIAFVMPVKLDTNTRVVQVQSNEAIKNSKVLPPKVEDNSFSEKQKGLGITEDDLK